MADSSVRFLLCGKGIAILCLAGPWQKKDAGRARLRPIRISRLGRSLALPKTSILFGPISDRWSATPRSKVSREPTSSRNGIGGASMARDHRPVSGFPGPPVEGIDP